MTQKEKIIRAWKRGRVLTPLQALREFGTLRLSARAYDAKRDGLDIRSKLVKRGKRHVCAYYLAA